METRGAVAEVYYPPQAEIPQLVVVEDHDSCFTPLPSAPTIEAIPAPRISTENNLRQQDGSDKLAATTATVIAEMPEDRFDRAKADRLIRTAGKAGPLVASKTIEKPSSANPTPAEAEAAGVSAYPTLMDAIRAAAGGDKQALKFVEMNVRTAAVEITLKSGHITKVPIYINESGKPVQYGQLMDDVFSNALKYASDADKIFKRSVAETRNGMRVESAHRRGLLKNNYILIISRYADGLTDKEAAGYGFFPDTKSCAIQVITEVAKNELVQESAFVAGVKQKGAERHDVQTVTGVGNRLGVNLAGKDDAETIDCAMLIPKQQMPNGAIDVVRLFDEIAGTFFGEDKPVQDYLTYLEQCKEREAALESTIQRAVKLLIAEHDQLLDPITANERLHKLIEGELVDRSIDDKEINPAVFGAEAAHHIAEARAAQARGDTKQVEASRSEARRTAKSTLCPSARNQKDGEKDDKAEATDGDNETSESSGELCIIETENCYCCKYNLDGSLSPVRLTVKAFHDSQGTLRCMRTGCGAWINKKGTKSDIGAIARRGERRKAAAAKEKLEEAAAAA